MSKSVIHSEKAPHHTWLLIVFRLLTLFFIGMFSYMALNGVEGWQSLAITSFLMVWATLSFSNMHYELHEERFEAWLWPFSSKTPYTEITSVEIHNSYPWYVGFGMHFFAGTWWLTSHYGEYVLISRQGKSAVAFTPKNPRTFVKMIEERRKGSFSRRL